MKSEQVKINGQLSINNNSEFKKFLYVISITVILGLFAHAYIYLNPCFGHDSVYVLSGFSTNTLISMGRFVTPVYRKIFRGMVTVPWLCGILSLIFVSFTVYIIVNLLNIKSKILTGIIGGVLVTDYAMIVTNASYVYTIDAYRLSVFFAVLAVYCVEKYKYGVLLYAFFLCGSLGIYQAHLSVTITLVLIMVIKKIVEKHSTKEISNYILKTIFATILGLVLYLFMMKLAMYLYGTSASSYMGMDTLGDYNQISIISLIKKTYIGFKEFFLNNTGYFPSGFKILHISYFCAVISVLIYFFKMNNSKKIHMALVAFIFIVLPVFVNISYITSKGKGVHDLTFHGYSYVYILGIYLFDRLFERWKEKNNDKIEEIYWLKTYKSKLVSMLLVLSFFCIIIYNNIVFSNGLYMRRQLIYEATFATMTRVVYTIEDTEGYIPGQPLLVLYKGEKGMASYIHGEMNNSGFSRFNNVTGFDDYPNTAVTVIESYEGYFRDIMGIPTNFVDDETRSTFTDRPEVKEMPVFPAKGYCKVIDGVMVVKLNE